MTVTPLSARYAAIIYNSDTAWEDYYRDKFRARRGVMLHAVRMGWSIDECLRVFADTANPGSRLWTHGADERPLRPAEITRRIMRDYQTAHAKAMAQPSYRTAAEARQRIGELIAAAKVYPWRSRTGRTDRDVLGALHARATDVGTDSVDMPVRDITLAAGIAERKTVTRSLRRLESAGWVTPLPEAAFGQARRYKLSGPLSPHMTMSEELHIHVGSFGATACPDHEVWLRLGKAAMALYQALDVAPASARELARRANVNRKTASRQLPVLASYGLALRSDHGWSFGRLSPDEVVTAMGWIEDNSRTVQRRTKADADREWFRWRFGLGTAQSEIAA